MSIARVFSEASPIYSTYNPKPRAIIPKPSDLTSSKRGTRSEFIKSVLPNARLRGGKTSGCCVQIHGEWSSGKTLFLDFIAVERYEEQGLGGVCNFPLKVPEYEMLNDKFMRIDTDTGDELYGIEALSEIKQSIILIDELQRYVDSYMSKSQSNLFISNIIADMGKQGCDFYYTNQHHNAAPTRVRTNISFVVYPQYNEVTGWVHVYCFHSITQYLYMNPFFYFGFYAPDYWDYYDTRYKVEDYVLKFRPQPFIKHFLRWCPDKRIDKDDIYDMRPKKLRDTLKLFDATEGCDLSSNEITLIMTEMDFADQWVGTE